MSTTTNFDRVKLFTLFIAFDAILLSALGVALAHFEVVPPMTGALLFVLGCLNGLVSLVLAVVVWFTSRSLLHVAIGLAGGLPLLLLLGAILDGAAYPAINDISTDLTTPPDFVHAQTLPDNQGRDFAYPEAFKPTVAEAYPELKPRYLPMSETEAFAHALAVARAMPGWEITYTGDTETDTFEGVATTQLFRWRDDFVVRVTSSEGESRIDMRSKSRDGKGDLGANAKRIQAYFERLGVE